MEERQQVTVSLPAGLVRQVKQRAVDTQRSLSDLVADVLAAHLASTEAPPASTTEAHPDDVPAPGPEYVDDGSGVRLRPMVHVSEMAAAVDFYAALGARIVHGSRDGDWVLLRLGDGELGLLAHPPNPAQGEGAVELNFEAAAPLDQVEARLRAAGARISRPTTDEAFGRQLQLVSPDGLLIKIDEVDPGLFT